MPIQDEQPVKTSLLRNNVTPDIRSKQAALHIIQNINHVTTKQKNKKKTEKNNPNNMIQTNIQATPDFLSR